LTTKLRAFGVVGCGTEAQAITTAAFCANANGAALKIAKPVRMLTNHFEVFMLPPLLHGA
jgi:hypothetical protein